MTTLANQLRLVHSLYSQCASPCVRFQSPICMLKWFDVGPLINLAAYVSVIKCFLCYVCSLWIKYSDWAVDCTWKQIQYETNSAHLSATIFLVVSVPLILHRSEDIQELHNPLRLFHLHPQLSQRTFITNVRIWKLPSALRLCLQFRLLWYFTELISPGLGHRWQNLNVWPFKQECHRKLPKSSEATFSCLTWKKARSICGSDVSIMPKHLLLCNSGK